MELPLDSLYHLASVKNLTTEKINSIFARAESYEKYLKTRIREGFAGLPLNNLRGTRIYIVFLEESTRTFCTFSSAAKELGAIVVELPLAKVFSSFAKEEALKHAIQFFSGVGAPHLRLADIIIIRHFEPDAVEKAANFSNVPVISAGAGGPKGDHVTQGLLDAYGYPKMLGQSDKLSILFMGDVRFSRIIPSELPILSMLYPNSNLKCGFAAPEGFKLSETDRQFLTDNDIPLEEVDDAKEVASTYDIVYTLRVQKNRLDDLVKRGLMLDEEAETLMDQYQQNKGNYTVTKKLYDCSGGALFCHPGPISEVEQEINPDIEHLPRMKFLEQWSYGYPVRMAILYQSHTTQRNFDKQLIL